MNIAIASDRSGFPLKDAVAAYLTTRTDVHLIDFGLAGAEENEPYDGQAPKVATAIQRGEAELGILVCGTGQGMGIVANKHRGIYAVVQPETEFAARRGRIINNANVLTMGGWVTAPFVGVEIARAFIDAEFTVGMEEKAEWLRSAYDRVQALERGTFAS